MFTSFWATIKASRSLAYFAKALGDGNVNELKQKWKENASFRRRVGLSAIIAAATVAIAGRTIYRNVKRSAKKNRKNARARDSKRAQESFSRKSSVDSSRMNYERSATNSSNYNSGSDSIVNRPVAAPHSDKYSDEPLTSVNLNGDDDNSSFVSPVTQSSTIQNTVNTQNEDPFFVDGYVYDNDLLDKLDNLYVFKKDENKNREGSIYLSDDDNIILVNETGIYDENHEQLLPKKANSVQVSLFINDFKEYEYKDLINLAEWYLKY